jgi:hypothetical protein
MVFAIGRSELPTADFVANFCVQGSALSLPRAHSALRPHVCHSLRMRPLQRSKRAAVGSLLSTLARYSEKQDARPSAQGRRIPVRRMGWRPMR